MNNQKNVISLIQSALNKNVRTLSPVSGGSIASSFRADLEGGDTLFVKTSPQHPDMFIKEANGLRELHKANTLRTPEVIMVNEEMLILEFLQPAPLNRSTHFFEQFGKHFATLHRHTAKQFGFSENNYIGSTPQVNLPAADSWKEFFIVNRLEFQFHLAEENGYKDKEIISLFTRIEKQIERLIPDDGEPPALLHGDLWNGNFLCLENNIPALIDPAVFYGHREADLAMTMLFGGFNEAFYVSYNETYPLHDEWKRRCELYKLYHLFNHLNLFGEGYYAQIYDTMKYLLR